MDALKKTVSESNVRGSYEKAYANAGDQFVAWRRLGAVMKVQSIMRLTDPPRTGNVAQIRGTSAAEVVEIGAGTGAILEELSVRRPNWNLTAIDLAEASIAVIRKLRLPNLMTSMAADAACLPFVAKRFDLAILSHVIEHLPDPVAALREAHRIARLVIIEVPIEGTPALDLVWRARKLKGRPRIPNDLGHMWHYSTREWNRVFANAGLTILARRQYLLTREALVFGKVGRSRQLASLRAAGQVVLGTRIWGNLVYSHYAVLAS